MPSAPLAGPATMKPSKGVSLYSRWLNRPAGRVLARSAFRLGLSANAVTALSAGVTALGIAVLVVFEPSWPTGVTVAVLLALGFALDSADGQVARMSRTSSAAGEWLDHVVDAAKHVTLHAAVLVAWYRFLPDHHSWLLLPLLFQFVAVVTFSAQTTVALLKRLQRGPAAPVGPASTVRAVGLLPADYGVLCWSFVLWGAPTVFVGVYAAVMVLSATILLAFLVKWFQELSAGDSTTDDRS